MNDLISRSALLREFETERHKKGLWHWTGINAFILNAPAVDAVPKSYADQIRWERDIAIEQLEEIGCQLGQKMDDVKKKLDAVPVVHAEWKYSRKEDIATCKNCSYEHYLGTYHQYATNFCPACGADMRKKGEKHE